MTSGAWIILILCVLSLPVMISGDWIILILCVLSLPVMISFMVLVYAWPITQERKSNEQQEHPE